MKNGLSKITFAIITKNEERLLPQCLKSISRIADEIILIDNQSRDKTVQIARSFGAKVFSPPPTKNLACLRNFYLKTAKNPWILSLDADECISQKDISKIINLTKSKNINGFSFVSRLYTNKYDILYDWYPCRGKYRQEEKFSRCFGYIDIDWGVRLFKNSKNLRYEGFPHEMIEQSIILNGGKIKYTKIPIHHFKNLNLKKNSGLNLAKSRFKQAKKNNCRVFRNHYRHYYRLGRDYLLIERKTKQALKNIQKALKLNPKYIYSYFLLALIHMRKRKYKEAIEALRKTIKIKNNYIGAHYLLGLVYDKTGNYKLAKKELKKALSINSKHPLVLNSLGVVMSKLNLKSKAAFYFRNALKIDPFLKTAENNLKALR